MLPNPDLILYNKALYNKLKHITDIIFANPFAVIDQKENDGYNTQVWWHIIIPKPARMNINAELSVKISVDSPLIGWYILSISNQNHHYQYVIDTNRQEVKLSASSLTKDGIQEVNDLYSRIDKEQERINQEHLNLLSSNDGLNLDVKRIRIGVPALEESE